MNKILKFALIFLLTHCAAFAFESELDLHYRLGTSDFSLNHSPGVAFTLYPFRNLGFSVGLDYSMRKKMYPENTGASIVVASGDESIEFSYKFGEYKEELSANLFLIPVLMKFRWDYFYIASGVKFGISQNMKANFAYKDLKTDGCVQEWSWCFDNFPHLGFGEQNDSSFTTKIKSKTLYMLATETGARIKISNNIALLFGLYADYSLNKAFERNLPNTVEWEEYSDEEAGIKVSDNWKSWQPWSLGADLRVSYATSNSKATTGMAILIFNAVVALMIIN